MILNALAILWLALASAVAGLALYRKLVSMKEDDQLHVGQFDAPQNARQLLIASRLDFVDRWGITLTVSVVAFGVILAAIYIYQAWVASNQIAF